MTAPSSSAKVRVAETKSSTRTPVRAVLDQIGAGTPTLAEIARNTGLDESLVRAAVDHLVRTGRVAADRLPIGCPPGGCGSCGAADACGAPSSRPTLVTLSLRR
jgi:hypothetical protein